MFPGSLIRSTAYAAAVVLAVVLAPLHGAHANDAVEKFYGSYVGSGTAEVGSKTQIRDLDVTIESYKDEGFTLKWITVVRGADGARTGDDVKRREVSENFIPIEDKENVFVLAPKGGLFQKSDLPNPLLGDAVRWAALEGDDASSAVEERWQMMLSASTGAALMRISTFTRFSTSYPVIS